MNKPKSPAEKLAHDYLKEGIRDLFAIKLSDLGFPNIQDKSFYDFTEAEVKAFQLAKDSLMAESGAIIHDIRMEIIQILSELNKQE